MRKLIPLLFIAVVLFTGCKAKPKETPQPVLEPAIPASDQDTEVKSPSAAEEKAGSNLFDAGEIKVGDEIVGLKVVNIEVQDVAEEDYAAYVDFEGEVTVSGDFKHNLNDEFLDHEISFRVDEESAAKLPKLAHDRRYVWFMFMNHDEAEKALGPPGTEGKATVTIKDYSIKYAHTEIWNTAELVRVD